MRASFGRCCAILLLASFALRSQPAPPGDGNVAALISRVRESALAFHKQLLDFICIQQVSRGADHSGKGNAFKPLDTAVMELRFVSGRENYRLLSVNGKTDDLQKRMKQGYFRPGGEFGTALQWIFDPKAAAEFAQDRDEIVSGKRQCVLRYRVPRETTTLVMAANLDRVPLGHRGFVYVDCESGAVERIHIETDPAMSRQGKYDVAVGSKLDVVYGPVTIASKAFRAPLYAEETGIYGRTWVKVILRFEEYRKYESDSTITFDK